MIEGLKAVLIGVLLLGIAITATVLVQGAGEGIEASGFDVSSGLSIAFGFLNLLLIAVGLLLLIGGVLKVRDVRRAKNDQ